MKRVRYTILHKDSASELELHFLSETVGKNATVNTVHEKWTNNVAKSRSGSNVRLYVNFLSCKIIFKINVKYIKIKYVTNNKKS
jgi:ssRNA-specific RNase YbeY (16S rRNA maturation enzyme)